MTNEQALADWRRRYEAGERLTQIAAGADVSVSTIGRALREAGVAMRPRGRTRGTHVPGKRARIEAIRAGLAEGARQVDLAKLHGVSKQYVHIIAKSMQR